MGRPKKSEQGPIPTKERILQKALELFAEKGINAVSVRDITKPLKLNQATLYIHYKNKADLVAAIFTRLQERLLDPGFVVPPPEYFHSLEDFQLPDFLIEGAKRFFGRSNVETQLTWRLIMTSQFRHAAARESIEAQILDAPASHFGALFRSIQAAGRIREDVDPMSAGRIMASIFLEYSFRAHLRAAWQAGDASAFDRLCGDLRTFADSLVRVGT